jgi:hypothetical protein
MQQKNNENTNTFTLHTKIDIQWYVKNEKEAENLNLTWFKAYRNKQWTTIVCLEHNWCLEYNQRLRA